MFSQEKTIDMRFICLPERCSKDAGAECPSSLLEEMGKAAKHEYEELQEGAWLEPGLALLLQKMKENWIE